MNKQQRAAWLDFGAGWVTALSLVQLFQDAVGKEAYLRLVETTWWPWWITTPVNLFFIVLFGWIFWSRQRRAAVVR